VTKPQTIVPPPNNTPYIVAVVVMMALGVIGVVAVVILRPSATDNMLVIAALVGFLTPTTVSLLAFMKAQETHVAVNSRLDAWLAAATESAHSKGMDEGRKEGQIAADARTDTLAENRRQG
jgi:hypothetical protein